MYTDDDLRNLSAEEKKKQQRNFQMEIIVLDSDTRKIQSRKALLDAEIRKIGMDQERARIELENKKKEYETISYQIIKNEDTMKHLKKKLNLL